MPGTIPPYAEEACRCGHGEPPLDALGPYRGLCATGKAEALERRAAKRRGDYSPAAGNGRAHTELEDEIRSLHANKQPRLSAAVRELVPAAERLEVAIVGRDAATQAARAALDDFKEKMQLVGRVAQSLVNRQFRQD